MTPNRKRIIGLLNQWIGAAQMTPVVMNGVRVLTVEAKPFAELMGEVIAELDDDPPVSLEESKQP